MFERIIRKIPAKLNLALYRRVAIYCRVSTNHTAQEESLKAQIDRFQKMVDDHRNWILVKTYSETVSGRNTSERAEFLKLMNDCRSGKIDLVITKSISRFGRNTTDILSNIRELKKYNVEVFFEVENLWTLDSTSELMLSIVSAIAQEDSASKSQNIRMGIEYRLRNGTSHLYFLPCYGYRKDANGDLVIDERQAKNVRWIFDLYLHGHSVASIIRELRKRRIRSPSGKTIWSKHVIDTLLTNEKYVGDVIVGKTFKHEFPSSRRSVNNGEHKKFEIKDVHEPIISREMFDKVQQDHRLRSNIGIEAGKIVRKNTRYSMKSPAMEKVA